MTESGIVTALQGVITTNAFMSQLTALIPVVGGVLVFAFAYRLVRRLIGGASKGKAKI